MKGWNNVVVRWCLYKYVVTHEYVPVLEEAGQREVEQPQGLKEATEVSLTLYYHSECKIGFQFGRSITILVGHPYSLLPTGRSFEWSV